MFSSKLSSNFLPLRSSFWQIVAFLDKNIFCTHFFEECAVFCTCYVQYLQLYSSLMAFLLMTNIWDSVIWGEVGRCPPVSTNPSQVIPRPPPTCLNKYLRQHPTLGDFGIPRWYLSDDGDVTSPVRCPRKNYSRHCIDKLCFWGFIYFTTGEDRDVGPIHELHDIRPFL